MSVLELEWRKLGKSLYRFTYHRRWKAIDRPVEGLENKPSNYKRRPLEAKGTSKEPIDFET